MTVQLVFERVKPASAYRRVKDEAYPTPWWTARAVLPWLGNGKIWEPAAGSGRLVRGLRHQGRDVHGTTSDFLEWTGLPHQAVRIICTNPPYGHAGRLAVKFIEHALDLMEQASRLHTVAMLLRVDFDSAGGRTRLFRDCPYWAVKVVLLDRVKWFNGGEVEPSTNHAWFIWRKAHAGPPLTFYTGKAPKKINNIQSVHVKQECKTRP
jgi:hypothetical protein